MSIDSKGLEQLANLARLSLKEEQVPVLTGQINKIVELADQLAAQPTEGVKPMAHPLEVIQAVSLRLREDVVTEVDEREANLANAPSTENNLFLVPKVID